MSSLPEFTKKFIDKIKKSKRVILFLHKSPDLDSIGSNFGVLQFVQNFNSQIEIVIISVDELSTNLKNIIKKYSNYEPQIIDPHNFVYNPNDLAVFIDFAEIHRASRIEEAKLPDFVDRTIIDHHVLPEFENILNFIDTQNISASRIVHQIYNQENLEISKESYIFQILGILGDSGFLRFKDKNFTQSLDVIKSYCEKFGTDEYFNLIAEIEKNMPVEEFLLEGIYLSNLNYDEINKYAYTTMTLNEREKRGVSRDYSEFLNGATTIRNVGNSLFTFSITEDKKEKNKFNISFRACSGTGFNVRDIATKLGGGGHIAAAGAPLEASSMEEAIERVRSAINELNELRTTNISN